jgi:polysaccharide biosynthesis transport protein
MTEQSRISITPYIDTLYRYRFAGLSALGAGIVLTLLLLAIVPRTYSSSATLMFAAGKVPGSNDSAAVNDQLEARMQTLAISVLSSDRLAALVDSYNLYPGHSKTPAAVEDVTAYMRKRISIVPLKPEQANQSRFESRLFRLSYEYSKPMITQAVVSRLAQLMIQEDLNESERKANASAQFLGRQAASLRVQLDSRSDAIKTFEQRNRGSLPQDINANLNMLGNLHTELEEARRSLATADTRRMDLGRDIAEAQSKGPNSASSSEGDTFTSPEEAIATLETRLTMLRAQYSDQHPDVVRLREDIAALKQQVSASGRSGASGDPNPMIAELHRQDQMLVTQEGSLRSHIADLEVQIEECRKRIAATPSNEQLLDSLNREYDVMAKSYHQVVEQRIAAELSRNLERSRGGEQLQLLEAPKLPRHPTFPDTLTFVASGVAMSLCLALALPFALFFTDTSYSDAEDLQRQSGLRILASIPDMNGHTDVDRLISVQERFR